MVGRKRWEGHERGGSVRQPKNNKRDSILKQDSILSIRSEMQKEKPRMLINCQLPTPKCA